jgi:predicted phage-related endonuclease
MTKINQIKSAPGFEYSDIPQRSPEWIKARQSHVSASRLGDWLSVSRAKGKEGTPLKARLDYEKELAYERQFGVSFEHFTTQAMELGIQYEPIIRDKYSRGFGIEVTPAGVFVSERFAASPDGLVGDDGLVEIKTLGDASFMDVLQNGVPECYHLQMQGQLYASDRKWCDFVAGNIKTQKMKVIRVERDEATIERIKESLEVLPESFTFSTEGIFDLKVEQEVVNTMEVMFE